MSKQAYQTTQEDVEDILRDNGKAEEFGDEEGYRFTEMAYLAFDNKWWWRTKKENETRSAIPCWRRICHWV